MSRAVQVPGEPTAPPALELSALNNADSNPDRVAAEREALTQSRAASAAVERGDLAGAQKILAEAQAAIDAVTAPRVQEGQAVGVDMSQYDGDVLSVSVPVLRTSSTALKYGRELPWPVGTPLDADKKPCVDGADPVYVVGNLETREGWLVNRAIALSNPAAA